jgi:hypothetical protein
VRAIAMLAFALMLGGCQIAPQVAVSAGVTLLGLANQDALAFLKFKHEQKACATEPEASGNH